MNETNSVQLLIRFELYKNLTKKIYRERFRSRTYHLINFKLTHKSNESIEQQQEQQEQ